MSIIRVAKKHNPFVMIDKTCLEDTRLSWKAKGLLAYLLSRPDNWDVKVSHLIKQSTDGRDAVYATINELRQNGYCYRSPEQRQDAEGKLIGYEYTIYEIPEPCTDFPDKENPDRENPTHNNNDSNKKDLNKDDDEQFAELVKLYNQIQLITPLIADHITDAVEDYTFEWVKAALERTILAHGTSWNYVDKVLKNMKKNGYDWTPPTYQQKKDSERNNHGFTKDTRPDAEREAEERLIEQYLLEQAGRATNPR